MSFDASLKMVLPDSSPYYEGSALCKRVAPQYKTYQNVLQLPNVILLESKIFYQIYIFFIDKLMFSI